MGFNSSRSEKKKKKEGKIKKFAK